ncbi:Mis12-Mtw1 protein family-domain-containing protein [Thelonectria olida]|uniref:Mis12-Mtw1 protein family-domain-containing protein n=1 Tax=Thelonectria olida TaxID=1576542 RepID=A0A9P9AX52_9HYPO|nr:Mis12-Mtw1 protein family-domain-containing protein [Thelonectria olida]
MTTLVTTRRPLQILSMSNQAERRTSKRLAGRLHREDATSMLGANHSKTAAADYERDDDFQFVRKSKRAKTEKEKPAEKAAPEPEPPKKLGRGRKAKQRVVQETIPENESVEETTATAAVTEPTITKTTRKSARRKPSVDASNEEPPLKVPKRATRKSTRISGDTPADEPPPQTNGASSHKLTQKPTQKRDRNGEAAPKRPVPNVPNWDESPAPRAEASKIALPMSDTPVINRNKEMRKKNNGSRRSSLGMRGRRASSLIDSGQSAIPHREVKPAEFYKHIEASQLEPRRMKQLLTWCGERSLSEKPPHGTANANAILGGKIC